MSIQDWSENMVLVELPGEPQTSKELENVVRHVRDRGGCGVVADFSGDDSHLQLAGSAAASESCWMAADSPWSCASARPPADISVTGLDGVFDIVEDRFGNSERGVPRPYRNPRRGGIPGGK